MSRHSTKPKRSQPSNQEENPIIETIKTVVIAGALAFGIRTYIAEARYIPSGSMLPTLQINDRLIIEKIGYRFNEPKRGDIVVFYPPESASVCNALSGVPATQPRRKDAYIKRVIGLPGDVVEVKDQKVFINDQPISESYIAQPPSYPFGPYQVEPDEYLVFGDNRDDSCDSHYWADGVPRENLIGRAIVRFWPLNRLGSIKPEPNYPNLLQ